MTILLRDPACALLKKYFSPFHSGIRRSCGVRPRFTKETVVRSYNRHRRPLLALRNEDLFAHLRGAETLYYTCNGAIPRRKGGKMLNGEALPCIDIDCHRRGTLDSAIRFAEYLKDRFFPGLYYEVSTNGNGVHGYPVFVKGDYGDERLHSLLMMLQDALRGILREWLAAHPEEEVEAVEIKGLPPRISWNYDGTIKEMTFGTLAKVPREIRDRLDEFKATARIDAARISELYREYRMAQAPIILQMPARGSEQAPARDVRAKAGSISGCAVPQEDLDLGEFWVHLGRKLFPSAIATSGREIATAEDVGIVLMLGEAFTRRPNEDGSLPVARFAANWEHCREIGAISRAWSPKRFSAIRNALDAQGLIDWTEVYYRWPTPEQKGQAARWCFAEGLMELIAEEKAAWIRAQQVKDEEDQGGEQNPEEGDREDEPIFMGTTLEDLSGWGGEVFEAPWISDLRRQYSSLICRRPIPHPDLFRLRMAG